VVLFQNNRPRGAVLPSWHSPRRFHNSCQSANCGQWFSNKLHHCCALHRRGEMKRDICDSSLASSLSPWQVERQMHFATRFIVIFSRLPHRASPACTCKLTICGTMPLSHLSRFETPIPLCHVPVLQPPVGSLDGAEMAHVRSPIPMLSEPQIHRGIVMLAATLQSVPSRSDMRWF